MTDAGGRPWIPDLIAGRYDIERELGSGAAAVTLLATDRTLGRRVAVKLLKPESEIDPEFTRRFSREARAAASVSHPNVVDVYDVGQDGDLLYLVMQLVDGEDLKRLMAREGALPWRRSVGIASQILAGLAAIHRAGIVHRDIKPQNVLIGRDGSVRVTDFGVAHVELDAELTTVGTTVGTAAYMAPEQAEGRDVTPAADIYAVGVMLFEMVTGRVPYSAATSMAVMLAHVQQPVPEPRAPSGLEPLPANLTGVIHQAMAKRPETRFRSAEAMRVALEQRDPGFGAGAATAQTQAVRSTSGTRLAPAVTRPPSTRTGASAPPRRSPPSPIGAERDGGGGGFSAFLVAVLVTLAIGLLLAAGVLWYLNEQGSGDDDPPGPGGVATEIIEPTVTPMPTDAPGPPEVIGPPGGDADEGPLPIETLPPTQTPVPEPTPTSIPPTQVPPTETPSSIEPIAPEPDEEEAPPNIVPIEPDPTGEGG